MAAALYLNHIAELDWLIALEFGRVDDGQPHEHWRGVSDSFGFLLDGRGRPELGFKIVDFSDFDPDDPAVAEIWAGPHFDVPVLGLRAVTPGEIVLAAQALFQGESSINRQFFSAAMAADGLKALALGRHACSRATRWRTSASATRTKKLFHKGVDGRGGEVHAELT